MEHVLFRDFLEKYEVITNKGAPINPGRAILSLFEGSEQQPASLVERVVEEQMRLMAEGESKEEAVAAAISQITATDNSIVIQSLASAIEYYNIMYLLSKSVLVCNILD